MKRILGNLPSTSWPCGWRNRAHGLRRAAGVGWAMAALALTGCAGFERDWRRAVAPTGAPAGSARATNHEGAWIGTWTSPGTGHSGRLRCLVDGPAATDAAGGQASFVYHATWAIFAGTFPTQQPVERGADGSVRSVGAWTLPKWAGGQYEYDIMIRGDRFIGTWKSQRESGSFEMMRASEAAQPGGTPTDPVAAGTQSESP